MAQAALGRGDRVAYWDGPSANLQKVVRTPARMTQEGGIRKICRRSVACAARREILPIGMVSAAVSRQPGGDGVPERCKFAHRRLLP